VHITGNVLYKATFTYLLTYLLTLSEHFVRFHIVSY